MKYFLDGFLRGVISDHISIQYLVHEGKQDLDKSIPRKLRGWRTPHSYFVVVRDKDGEDLNRLNERLCGLCRDSGRPDTLIKLAVHHLESWVLGDFEALATAFDMPGLRKMGGTKKYRNPDLLANASEEISRLVPGYQKVSGAREVARFIDPNINTSPSFIDFISGLTGFVDEHLPRAGA